MEDDISLAFEVRNNKYKNEKDIIYDISENIKNSYDLFMEANKIDISNNNGFILDKEYVNKILLKYKDEMPIIKTKDIIHKTDDMISSSIFVPQGIISVLFNGNTYVMLELIMMSILTHNVLIFSYDGYMFGTNGLLLNIVKEVLKKHSLNENMFIQNIRKDCTNIFNNYKSVNKTIIVGNGDFINKYSRLCNTDMKVSGYGNYDIYIDSIVDKELIEKIINQNKDINVYVNKKIKGISNNEIIVEDIDEAITYINYNESNYCSTIFTDNNELASKFINEVNSTHVLVNTSPMIINELDITQKDLLKEKKVILPNIYKYDGNKIKIKTE